MFFSQILKLMGCRTDTTTKLFNIKVLKTTLRNKHTTSQLILRNIISPLQTQTITTNTCEKDLYIRILYICILTILICSSISKSLSRAYVNVQPLNTTSILSKAVDAIFHSMLGTDRWKPSKSCRIVRTFDADILAFRLCPLALEDTWRSLICPRRMNLVFNENRNAGVN